MFKVDETLELTQGQDHKVKGQGSPYQSQGHSVDYVYSMPKSRLTTLFSTEDAVSTRFPLSIASSLTTA